MNDTPEHEPGLSFVFDSCSPEYDVIVEESDETVAVSITHMDNGDEMLACQDVEIIYLETPMAGRTVIDADSGYPLPRIGDGE